MPETNHTTNRHIPVPTGKDLIPEGPAEMEAIANALDAENRGEIDFLQAGVVKSTDWSFKAIMESSSECKIGSEAEVPESIAWLPLAAIGLVRSVTPKAKIKALKPSSLPGSGKYLTVGIELTPSTSDAAATVSVVSGVEQATQKAAEEQIPATTAGSARIRNMVILNTAGVYSIIAQEDARPWASTGEWQSLILGPKVHSTVHGRSESAGRVGRLRGAAIINAGEELHPGEPLLTVPSAFITTFHAETYILITTSSGSVYLFSLEATGELVLETATPIPAGTVLRLNATYPIF